MSDPMKGTPLAAFDLPDDVFGLGAAEVAYLLSRHDSAANQRSREVLMLDPRAADDAALLAGTSSLASRGWLTVGGDGRPETLSNAALVEYVVGATTRWTRIGLVGEGTTELDFVVLLESESLTALLQPRVLASWFFRLGEPDVNRGGLVAGLVMERLEASPASGVFIDVQTLGDSRNLAVRRSGDRFEALVDVAGPGTGSGGEVDEAGLRSAVAQLYPEPVPA